MSKEGARADGQGCEMPSGPQSLITMKDLGITGMDQRMLFDAQPVADGRVAKDLSGSRNQADARPQPPSNVEHGTGDARQPPTHPATPAHGVIDAVMYGDHEPVSVSVESAEPSVQGGGEAMGVETDSGSDSAVGPIAPLAASERANVGEPAAGKDVDMCGGVVVTGAGEREEQQVLECQSSSPQPSPSSTDSSRVFSDTGPEMFPSKADLQLLLRIWRASPTGEAEVTVDMLQAWLNKMTRRPVHVESTSEDVFAATWSSLSDIAAAYGAIKKKGYINGRRVLVCRPSVRLADWLTSMEGLIEWYDAAATAAVLPRASSIHRTPSPGSTHARAHATASPHAHMHKKPSHRGGTGTSSRRLIYSPQRGRGSSTSSRLNLAHGGFDGGGAWHVPPISHPFAPPPPFPQHNMIGPYAVGPHGLPFHPPLHGVPTSNPHFIFEQPPHAAYGPSFTHPHMMMAPDEPPPPYCYYEQMPPSPPMYMGPHGVPMHMHVPLGMQGFRVDGVGGGVAHGPPPPLHPHAHTMQQHQHMRVDKQAPQPPQGQQPICPQQQIGHPHAYTHSPGPPPPPVAPPPPHTSPPPLHHPYDHQQQHPQQPPVPPLLVLAPKGKQALTIVPPNNAYTPAALPASAADNKAEMPECLKEVQAVIGGFVVGVQGEKLKSEAVIVQPSSPPHPSPTPEASVHAAGTSGAAESGVSVSPAMMEHAASAAIRESGGVQARSLVRQPSEIPEEEDDEEGMAAVTQQHDHEEVEEEEEEEDDEQREHRRLREEGVMLMALTTDDDPHYIHTTTSPVSVTATFATSTQQRVQKPNAAAGAASSHTPSARTQALGATSATATSGGRHHTGSHTAQVSSVGSGGVAEVVVWVGGPGDDDEGPSAATQPSPLTQSSSSSTGHGAAAADASLPWSDAAPPVLTPTRATPHATSALSSPHTAEAKAHAQPLSISTTQSPATSDSQQHLPLEQPSVVVPAVPQTTTLVPPQYRFPKPPPPLPLRITLAKSLIRPQPQQDSSPLQGSDVAAKGVCASAKTGLRGPRQYHPLFGLSDFVILTGSSSPSSATQTSSQS